MDPDVIQVAWGKTLNIGGYETVRLDITARVNEGEDWREVLRALKLLVREQEQIIRARQRPPADE